MGDRLEGLSRVRAKPPLAASQVEERRFPDLRRRKRREFTQSANFQLCVLRLHRQSAPARWGQTGRLFETAGEMALMGEAARSRDLGQFLLARYQLVLGLLDLAVQQHVLRG